MSKNIFSVFSKGDSEDEREDQALKPAPAKPTKKELRAEDQQKREHYGDQVVKDGYRRDPRFDGPKNKGDYAPGEKRPYERHSGTGRPAFTKDFKKGGHGKGNVGRAEDDIKAGDDKANDKKKQNDEKDQKTEPQTPVPLPEPIITADEYLAQSGRGLDFEVQKAGNIDPKSLKLNEKEVKFVQPRVKDELIVPKKYEAKKKDGRGEQPVALNLESSTSDYQQNGKRRNNRKQSHKLDYNEQNFPSLN